MFEKRFLKTLKRLQKSKDENCEASQAISKIERQERLSSKEFLKIYDSMWKEGPTTKSNSPDSWSKILPSNPDDQ
jgi:hypothetical protein